MSKIRKRFCSGKSKPIFIFIYIYLYYQERTCVLFVATEIKYPISSLRSFNINLFNFVEISICTVWSQIYNT